MIQIKVILTLTLGLRRFFHSNFTQNFGNFKNKVRTILYDEKAFLTQSCFELLTQLLVKNRYQKKAKGVEYVSTCSITAAIAVLVL